MASVASSSELQDESSSVVEEEELELEEEDEEDEEDEEEVEELLLLEDDEVWDETGVEALELAELLTSGTCSSLWSAAASSASDSELLPLLFMSDSSLASPSLSLSLAV